jgi:hypothetical protein
MMLSQLPTPALRTSMTTSSAADGRAPHFERLHHATERADTRYKHELHYSPVVSVAMAPEFGDHPLWRDPRFSAPVR